MAKFITAEELKNRTSKNSEEKSKREFELQHRIIEYRLRTCEEPYILVPFDLKPEIRAELKAANYHLKVTHMSDENEKDYSSVFYIGSYELLKANEVQFPYRHISWEYWANVIAVRTKNKK
ncbi:MAG: hypothetical protein IJ094_01030 [Bacilli bacterium]|nr:hypothetical protein [Bacilli bacterium]